MKVLVIGAGGKTGRLVMERAMAAEHKVTALLHEKKEDEIFPAAVEIVHGDVRNPSRLDQVMTGQDAVIDVIGGSKPFLETALESSAAKVIVEVMKKNDVRRLIVVSALGAGDSEPQAGFFYRRLLMPLFLPGILRDKGRMEGVIEQSGLQFTIVRPPLLKDSDPTGQIKVVTGSDQAHSITRADLAQFLVDQLGSTLYEGQEVTIANQ